jgi:hypothetical protein
LNQTQSIKIVKLSKTEFRNKKDSLKTSISITPGIWLEMNDFQNIKNLHASPCLILYIKNQKTGRIISGHFPETNQERVLQSSKLESENKAELNQDQESISQKKVRTIADDFESYISLMKRIKSLGIEDSLEAYLFGQNFNSGNMLEDILEQEFILLDLQKSGINQSRIFDYRDLSRGKNIDDTIYDCETETIYHYHTNNGLQISNG